MKTRINALSKFVIPVTLLALASAANSQMPAFPLAAKGPVISRPTQPLEPFTVAGPRGVLVGSQDGQFESWILPVKLLSHLTIEANVEGYSVPIDVNPQSANIEVRPDRTTLTYSHIAFTLRQIMFSLDNAGQSTSTGPVVLFQIDCVHPLDLTFRFTPEMRWMWPKRNDGIPGPDWVKTESGGYYTLHMDYPDLAGAVTIPTATPGILAPYQERPQVHPLELHLHYDPRRDGNKFFPLLMAVGTTRETATNQALGQSLQALNAAIPEAYKAHAAYYEKLLADSTSIETPDKALNEAFQWGVVSIEQLKTHVPTFAPTPETASETALVAGYYASGDSARPGFGWFFGRDALYTLYAVNSFGDFALTRSELEFLIARQRSDGKIMHEYSQTAADPVVDWKSFPYMYAAADATPLFLMALRDYYRASGDLAFLQKHKEAIEKAWAFETAASSDTDHDGIYDNSQGTGWVESWPHDAMPHQEIYLALLDKQASLAYAGLAAALSDPAASSAAAIRAANIASIIEKEYYDPEKGCYAFSHNAPGDPNGATDKSTTVYPSIAWWDYNPSQPLEGSPEGAGAFRPLNTAGNKGASAPEMVLAHAADCLTQFASPTLATDWGLRDVATTEPFYDGMSYHQGSVWPLFTGWAALAEYRGNQPLAGEQMLMQNVDLTWAQDPGAVTELLSGDYFVPFGRSTSHQLWSSAMVLTPTLRGLFGISLDAANNTITVNPHLPASWDHAKIRNLRLGSSSIDIEISRPGGHLEIVATPNGQSDAQPKLISDIPGSKMISGKSGSMLSIPLPAIEIGLPDHDLPTPGSRPEQLKVASATSSERSLTLKIQGKPGDFLQLPIRRNQPVIPKVADSPLPKGAVSIDPRYLNIQFPNQGPGWQTLEFTLTW